MEFKSKSGLLLATNYERLVIGGRGKYIEFSREQIIWNNFHIPENQKYRFDNSWKNRVYYYEYRSNDKDNVKLYDQLKIVSYADYKIGKLYISPNDLIFDGELILIKK